MWKGRYLFFVLICLFIFNPILVMAQTNVSLNTLREHVGFHFFTPELIEQAYLKVNEPKLLDSTKPITFVQLHYFNQETDQLFLTVTQHRARGHLIVKEKSKNDQIDGHEKTKKIVEEFKFNKHEGVAVKINKQEGRFIQWDAQDYPGGFLRWVQNGTFIELKSMVLNKEQLMEIAQNMR
ncbi:DUF4367 domain-containing protein [Alkalihalobacillus sp. 1P02AB]|uniref:DUF4367 domain-containing protein n=1 Tax=Alkalihalobacillus sp. 1P02AB TaxID=3132260 RepID=UPI0039A5B54B